MLAFDHPALVYPDTPSRPLNGLSRRANLIYRRMARSGNGPDQSFDLHLPHSGRGGVTIHTVQPPDCPTLKVVSQYSGRHVSNLIGYAGYETQPIGIYLCIYECRR